MGLDFRKLSNLALLGMDRIKNEFISSTVGTLRWVNILKLGYTFQWYFAARMTLTSFKKTSCVLRFLRVLRG